MTKLITQTASGLRPAFAGLDTTYLTSTVSRMDGWMPQKAS
jgi:hypothetical protein